MTSALAPYVLVIGALEVWPCTRAASPALSYVDVHNGPKPAFRSPVGGLCTFNYEAEPFPTDESGAGWESV